MDNISLIFGVMIVLLLLWIVLWVLILLQQARSEGIESLRQFFPDLTFEQQPVNGIRTNRGIDITNLMDLYFSLIFKRIKADEFGPITKQIMYIQILVRTSILLFLSACMLEILF